MIGLALGMVLAVAPAAPRGGRAGPIEIGVGARIVVQLQDVRQWGQSASTISQGAFTGAHQAFAELSGRRGRLDGLLRVGRQEVTLWTMRLIGNAPWQPGMRAFDAARARLEVGRFATEAGVAILRLPRTLALADMSSVRTQGEQLAWAEASVRPHDVVQVHGALIVLRADDDPGLARDQHTIVVSIIGYFQHAFATPKRRTR